MILRVTRLIDWRLAAFFQATCSLFQNLLLVSHFIFVEWLYMRPCTECVYIRFGFCLLAVALVVTGCICASRIGRFAGTVAIGLSCAYDIYHSWILLSTETIGSCAINNPPFSLFGLERLFPTLFKPTGECGFTAPLVPFDAQLGAIQAWFISLYSEADGWYLIPSIKFGTMAECTLTTFVVMVILTLIVEAKRFKPHSSQRRNSPMSDRGFQRSNQRSCEPIFSSEDKLLWCHARRNA